MNLGQKDQILEILDKSQNDLDFGKTDVIWGLATCLYRVARDIIGTLWFYHNSMKR